MRSSSTCEEDRRVEEGGGEGRSRKEIGGKKSGGEGRGEEGRGGEKGGENAFKVR